MAAKKLQRRTRQRHADRRITFMRQCSEAREDPMAVAALQAVHSVLLKQQDQEQEQELEAAGASASASARLQAVFSRYTELCSTHYEFLRSLRHAADVSMERKQFVLLCTDAKLINRTRFTISDCNEVIRPSV